LLVKEKERRWRVKGSYKGNDWRAQLDDGVEDKRNLEEDDVDGRGVMCNPKNCANCS
jgi:hypothetical protein